MVDERDGFSVFRPLISQIKPNAYLAFTKDAFTSGNFAERYFRSTGESIRVFGRFRWFPKRAGDLSALEAGVAALDERRFSDALGYFDRALAGESESDRAVLHNKRGIALVRLRELERALDAFVAALEIEQHVPAIVNIGNLLLESGDIDDAIVHYEAALRIDDDYATAHLNLGVAFKRLGRRAEAVREFRRANRLESRLKRSR